MIMEILSRVRSRENEPNWASSLESERLSAAEASPQHNPVLTAGGSSDAEMATPTRPPELLPAIDRATPNPDGMAIANPYLEIATKVIEVATRVSIPDSKTTYTHIHENYFPPIQHVQ
jgi:hypothetical protein